MVIRVGEKLSTAVVIFTLLCLPFALSAREDNFETNHEKSPTKNAAETLLQSRISSNPFSRRFIRPSAWSKEEKQDLKPREDKSIENEGEDTLFFSEDSNSRYFKDLFRYIENLLYVMNHRNDGSLDESFDNVKIKMRDGINNDSSDKPKNDTTDNVQNSSKTDTLNNSANDGKMQSSATKDTLNSFDDDGNIQRLLNNESPYNKQTKENSKIKMQNSMDKELMDDAENNMKTETQNPTNIATLNELADDEEIQNSGINDICKRVSGDEKMQKLSNNNSLNNKQATENSKNKIQNSIDESISDLKCNKTKDYKNSNTTDITSDDPIDRNKYEEEDNEFDDYSANKNEDDDYTDEGNTNEDNIDDVYINNYDYESEDKENENEDENYTDEDNTNENDSYDVQINNYEYESKDKENEVEDDNIKENKFNKDDNTNEKGVERDNINKNKSNKDHNMNDNGDEDDYIKENKYNNDNNTNENGVERDDVKENKFHKGDKDNNMNENGDKVDYIKENKPNKDDNMNEDSVEDDYIKENKPNKDNNANIFPKFLIKTRPNQQNYSENKLPENQININGNEIPETAKSEKITNEEKPSSEFLLTSGEFIDDYINNRRSKIPEKKNEQPNRTEQLFPDKNDTANYIILTRTPTSKNNKDQNLSFDQSQNAGKNISSERNNLPLDTVNEDTPKQTVLVENYPQNTQNTFISAGKPGPSTKENENTKSDEAAPLKLVPFQQKQNYTNLLRILPVPQKNYNALTEPAIIGFQNNHLPSKPLYNSAPETNVYRPEKINPSQLISNNDVPFQNEGYLNDDYANYNFQNLKNTGMINDENQQLEQQQPTVLEQDMLSNIQYFPNQNFPNSPYQTKYFTNDMPEILMNAPGIEKPVPNTKIPVNLEISDNLQFNPGFNQMYERKSLPTDIQSSLIKMDTNVPQDQLGVRMPQNQIDKTKTLNTQSQSDNLLLQDNLSLQQTPFPQTDSERPLIENEMMNRPFAKENNISSNILPTKEEFKNEEYLVPQNNTSKSKGLPHRSFDITKINLEDKPENKTLPPVIPETIAKLFISNKKATPGKPLVDESQKIVVPFQESEEIDQEGSNLNYKSNKRDNSDELSNYSYDSKYDEDESEETTNLPVVTINDATKIITQKSPSIVASNVTKSPETFGTQNEVVTPRKEEKFDSILDYIYKLSNNSFFKH